MIKRILLSLILGGGHNSQQMSKTFFGIILMMAFMIPLTMNADELTIYGSETGTNSRVPYETNNIKNYQVAEFIIPSTLLTSMVNKEISAIQFYTSIATTLSLNGTISVYLMETNQNDHPLTNSNRYFIGPANATKVYEGSLTITDSKLTISFNTNYLYEGSNLAICLHQTAVGSTNNTYKAFYGKSNLSQAASLYANNSSSITYSNELTGTGAYFIPRTTFTYASASCPQPKKLSVTAESQTATFTWEAGNDTFDGNYDVAINTTGEDTPSEGDIVTDEDGQSTLSFSFSELTPETTYYAYVRAHCGSGWVKKSFETSELYPTPTNLAASVIKTTSAIITWDAMSGATAYNFKYRIAESEWTTENNITTNTKELSELTNNTEYEAQVQSVYTGGTSSWSATYSFTTLPVKTNKYDKNNWSSSYNWDPSGVPTVYHDVNINYNIYINQNAAANNIHIASNTTLTIQSPYTLSCNSINNDGTLIIEEGAQLVCNNAVQATVQKSITGYGEGNDKWYFIASPIDVDNLAPTSVSNMLSNDYDLYQLNNTTWENYKAHEGNANPNFNLANGRGYLYANSTNVNLGFAGTTKPYDADYEISVAAGWNLVGNPYTFEAYVNTPYYAMNEGGTGITATTVSTSTAVKPCTGIIVKADEAGTVKFLNEAPASSANNGNLQIVLAHNVVSRDGASTKSANIDNAIVSFNEGSKLEKFYFGEQAANIFIPQNGDEYAIAFSDRKGEVPVNFKAKETGTYTINFDGTDLNNIKLIDKLENLVIDLNENSSYTFIGSPADRAERFVIRFENSEQPDNSVFAYQSGNDIIVSGEGELQIFDVMGRMVSRQYVSGVETINAMPYGVYIFKLNGMTQKIVVR